MARAALQAGGGAPTVLNAANEVAVEQFLNKKVSFLDIARIVEITLEKVDNKVISTLEEVAEVDAEARVFAASLC